MQSEYYQKNTGENNRYDEIVVVAMNCVHRSDDGDVDERRHAPGHANEETIAMRVEREEFSHGEWLQDERHQRKNLHDVKLERRDTGISNMSSIRPHLAVALLIEREAFE